jgi:lipoprotein-anchoring transpeptidase ErfK/SrfK
VCSAAVAAATTALAAAASAAPPTHERLPAAGELVTSQAAARAAPNAQARVVRVIHQLADGGDELAVVLAVAAQEGADHRWWYELSLPGRPNGQRGWVRGDFLDLRPVADRIIVHVGARRLDVRRIADDRLLLTSIVAVGKAGAETPLGRNFYVQARYRPSDPFYGPFVLVTSAYSKLSDWPGGGLAGIHGTDEPGLLGQAVSHGCVRVPNSVALALERLAPLGTPIDLLP